MKKLVLALLALAFAAVTVPTLALELWETLPEYPVPKTAPVQTGKAAVNGVEIYYEIYGKGEPLLLIHGGIGTTTVWGNQINAWSDKYEVIVAETRGHGRSTDNGTPYTYQLFADDYVALLDYLKIPKVTLIGWSDGGIIGLDFAIRHPDRLNKLVAYAANIRPEGLLKGATENAAFQAYIERQHKTYDQISSTPGGFDAYLERITKLWATEPNWTNEQIAKITIPTLVIDGAAEREIDPEHTKLIASLIKGSELVFIPDVGHFAFLQKPAEFDAAVEAFLAR